MCLGGYVGRLLLTLYTFYLVFILYVIYSVGVLLPRHINAILGVGSDILRSTVSAHLLLLGFCGVMSVVFFVPTRKICRFKPFSALLIIIFFSLEMGSLWHKTGKAVETSSYKNEVMHGHALLPSLGDDLKTRHALIIAQRAMIFLDYYWPGPVGISVYAFNYLYHPIIFPLLPHIKRDRMVLSQGGSQIENIIFIIGESDTSLRHHDYFPQDTPENTPYISQHMTEKTACVVGNAISAAAQTPDAVAVMASFSSPDHPEKMETEQNLLELAHKAGYKIYWVDEQTGGGVYDISQTYLSGYADVTLRPDFRHSANPIFLDAKKFPLTGDDDLQLMPIFNEIISERSASLTEEKPEKHFIILHLRGSHEEYRDKYDQEDKKALPYANEYDLSIHHTDRLLGEIITRADRVFGSHYALFYSSDHGEDVIKYHTHGILYGNLAQYKPAVFLAGNAQSKEMLASWCQRVEELRNLDGNYQQIMDKVILGEMMGYVFDKEALTRMKNSRRIYHVDGKIYDWGSVPDDTQKGTPAKPCPECD